MTDEPEIGAIAYRYTCLRAVEVGPIAARRYREAGWDVCRLYKNGGWFSLDPGNWLRYLAQEFGVRPFRYEGNRTWRLVEENRT